MKKLLILGASIDQLSAYQLAKKKGLYIIAVDGDPNALCFKFANEHFVISIMDLPKLLDFVQWYSKKSKIDGVMTMGIDIPHIAATLARKLNLPEIPALETAKTATNKFLMRKRWQEKGIPIPWFCEITTIDELKKVIKKRGYPVIIKPQDGRGSRGVLLIRKGVGLGWAFAETLKFSFNKRLLVEEYLQGPQISTESILYDDFATTPGFVDRNYNMIERLAPRIIENGGETPSILLEKDQGAIVSLVEKAARALGVKRGVAKGDAVLTVDGPKMIEMAVRLSDKSFSGGFIPYSIGVDIVDPVIDMTLGLKPKLIKLKPKFGPFGVVSRYFFPQPGKFIGVRGLNEVKKWNWIKWLDFYIKRGARINIPRHHSERLGGFMVVGKDREEAVKRAELVLQTIQLITR